MRPDARDLRGAVEACLEGIVDPCSAASGAPAGLVSMGLVGPIETAWREDGAHLRVTLFITEPGCLMGSLFELTARRALAALPGVAGVEVAMDYTHVWGPEQMTPDYRRRLADVRACRVARFERELGPRRTAGGVK